MISVASYNTFYFLECIELLTGVFIILSTLVVGATLYFIENRKESLFYFMFHSFAQTFFIPDIKIKTSFGRLVQATYWFTVLILVSSYTALMADQMIADNELKSGIHVYEVYGMKVSCSKIYESIMKSYGATTIPYPGNILQAEDSSKFMDENNLDGCFIYIYI